MFGVSATTVEHWIRVGCPFIQRGAKGRAWQFSTADVYDWRLDRLREEHAGKAPQSEAELKLRKLAAETSKAELELAKAMGLVAPVDEMERAITAAFAEFRANVRNVPGRVVKLLIGETDEKRFKRVLGEEIDQTLEALSTVRLLDESDVTKGDEAEEDD